MKHQIQTCVVGQMAANCYILTETASRKTIIIDPGDAADYIESTIARGELDPIAIIATHGHIDHVMAGAELQLAYNIPFFMHEADLFLLRRMAESALYFFGTKDCPPPPALSQALPDGVQIALGELTLEVTHTPGHTPGSICLSLLQEDIMFAGDTIFADGHVGRTDFSYSDPEALQKSVEKILKYDSFITLYPGHGGITTIYTEREMHGFEQTDSATIGV